MSEIKVDTLTGKTSADDITVTDGSATMKLQDGLAKCWTIFNGQNNVIANSLNLSSLTDLGTGQFKTNFSNSFTGSDYSATGLSGRDISYDQVGCFAGAGNNLSSSFIITELQYSTFYDSSFMSTTNHGDLA